MYLQAQRTTIGRKGTGMPCAPTFSVVDLLPINGEIPQSHLIVILKSYFDGGNEADSTQYDVVTLASVSGTTSQWRPFESEWKAILAKHKAPWLHTTDSVTFNKPFTRDAGWNEEKRDSFLSECVELFAKHNAVPIGDKDPPREGLLPFTVSIVLQDFKLARDANPEVPKNATEILAVQALYASLEWGRSRGVDFWYLIFDQNEPYRGHVSDRKRNPKAVKQVPLMDRVTHVGESDMRNVPALQIADLFAWCVSHKEKYLHKWQNDLLTLPRFDEWIEYGAAVRPIAGMAELVKSWKLPRRRPTR